jgi:hypothetical protein
MPSTFILADHEDYPSYNKCDWCSDCKDENCDSASGGSGGNGALGKSRDVPCTAAAAAAGMLKRQTRLPNVLSRR